MDVISVALISAGIATLALAVSAVTLWRTHFALTKPITVAGRLRQRIYPIVNDNVRWFMVSFDIPVSLCNPGAQPLLVQGVRVKLHFPDIPIPQNHELMHAKWEVKQEDVSRIDKNRFQWIKDLCPIDWMAYSVLPKATVTKHLIFEACWKDPVIQKNIQASLEILTTANREWIAVANWGLRLEARVWGELANIGTSIGYAPKEAKSNRDETHPKDLHKYTGSKEPIPSKGFDSSPSYLNYPNHDEK